MSNYIAVITSEDGDIHQVIGPFDTQKEAEQAGEAQAELIEDSLNETGRPYGEPRSFVTTIDAPGSPAPTFEDEGGAIKKVH